METGYGADAVGRDRPRFRKIYEKTDHFAGERGPCDGGRPAGRGHLPEVQPRLACSLIKTNLSTLEL